jgi:molecular chaperone GrpE
MTQARRPKQQHDSAADRSSAPCGGTECVCAFEGLQEEKVSLEARIAELEEQCTALQREEKYRLAEFDNYRRRTRQEQEEFRKMAAKELLAELLDIEDGFANAQSGWSESDPAAWREGFDLIVHKFSSILEKYGVKLIEAEGCPFDPAVHEALFVADEGGHEGEIVAQVLQRGYFLNEKVLRLAKVKVARGLGKAGQAQENK